MFNLPQYFPLCIQFDKIPSFKLKYDPSQART